MAHVGDLSIRIVADASKLGDQFTKAKEIIEDFSTNAKKKLSSFEVAVSKIKIDSLMKGIDFRQSALKEFEKGLSTIAGLFSDVTRSTDKFSKSLQSGMAYLTKESGRVLEKLTLIKKAQQEGAIRQNPYTGEYFSNLEKGTLPLEQWKKFFPILMQVKRAGEVTEAQQRKINKIVKEAANIYTASYEKIIAEANKLYTSQKRILDSERNVSEFARSWERVKNIQEKFNLSESAARVNEFSKSWNKARSEQEKFEKAHARLQRKLDAAFISEQTSKIKEFAKSWELAKREQQSFEQTTARLQKSLNTAFIKESSRNIREFAAAWQLAKQQQVEAAEAVRGRVSFSMRAVRREVTLLLQEYKMLEKQKAAGVYTNQALVRQYEILRKVVASNAVNTSKYSTALKGLASQVKHISAEERKANADSSAGGFGSPEWFRQRLLWFAQLRIFWGAYQGLLSSLAAVVEHEKQLHRALRTANSDFMSRDQIVKEYSSSLMHLTSITGQEYDKVGEALYQLGSAGLTAEESLSAVNSVMKLMVATEGDAQTLTKAVAGVYNNFADVLDKGTTQGEKFEQITGIMATAWKNHQVEISELTEGYKHFSASAKVAGLDLQEVTGILATLNDHMIKSGRAGRSLRSILSRMARQPFKFADAFGLTGDVKREFLTGKFDFIKIIEEVSKNINKGTVSTVELATVFERLGLRGADAFITLTRHSSEMIENIKEMRDAGSNLEEIFSEMTNTLQDKWAMWTNNAKNTFITFVTDVIPFVKWLEDSLTRINKSVEKATELTRSRVISAEEISSKLRSGDNVTFPEASSALDTLLLKYKRLNEQIKDLNEKGFRGSKRRAESLKVERDIISRDISLLRDFIKTNEEKFDKSLLSKDTYKQSVKSLKDEIAYTAGTMDLQDRKVYVSAKIKKLQGEISDIMKTQIALEKEKASIVDVSTKEDVEKLNGIISSQKANKAVLLEYAKEENKLNKELLRITKQIANIKTLDKIPKEIDLHSKLNRWYKQDLKVQKQIFESEKNRLDSIKERIIVMSAESSKALELKYLENERLNYEKQIEIQRRDFSLRRKDDPGYEESEEKLKNLNYKLEETISKMDRLKYYMNRGLGDAFADGFLKANAALGTFSEMVERAGSEIHGILVNTLASGLTTLGDSLAKGEDGWRDWARSAVESIRGVINQLFAMYIVKQLVGAFGGAPGGTSTSIPISKSTGTMPRVGTGGVIGDIVGFRKMAMGGTTSGPAMALLGDNPSGKELVIPSEKIKKDSTSGYVRDKEERGDLAVINFVDPDLMLSAMGSVQGKNVVLNHINSDIWRRGNSYNIVKGVR